jgi:hypothetical protein
LTDDLDFGSRGKSDAQSNGGGAQQSEFEQEEEGACEEEEQGWPLHCTGLRCMGVLMNVLIMEAGVDALKQFLLKKLQNPIRLEEFIQGVI